VDADHNGHGDGPRVVNMPTPRNLLDQAAGESGAPAPVLTFTPRQSYRRHGDRWFIEADDALDGDERCRPG
jgi:hypothetical protein